MKHNWRFVERVGIVADLYCKMSGDRGAKQGCSSAGNASVAFHPLKTIQAYKQCAEAAPEWFPKAKRLHKKPAWP